MTYPKAWAATPPSGTERHYALGYEFQTNANEIQNFPGQDNEDIELSLLCQIQSVLACTDAIPLYIIFWCYKVPKVHSSALRAALDPEFLKLCRNALDIQT